MRICARAVRAKCPDGRDQPHLQLHVGIRVGLGADVHPDGLPARTIRRRSGTVQGRARLGRRDSWRRWCRDDVHGGAGRSNHRRDRRRGDAARNRRAAATLAARLRPQAFDRHGVRRRRARLDDSAEPDPGFLRSRRQRLDRRSPSRLRHAGPADGAVVLRLHPGDLQHLPVDGSGRAAGRAQHSAVAETASAEGPPVALPDRPLRDGQHLCGPRLGDGIRGARRGRRPVRRVDPRRAELAHAVGTR